MEVIAMGSFGQNLQFAVRQVCRNPGFAAAVIGTLALAIGANTAVFSLVNALMLKSLPYAHPERMGTIFREVQGKERRNDNHSIDGQAWEELRDNVPSLISAVSSGRADGVNLRAGDRAEYVRAGRISARYLDVIGIHPGMGRNFSEEEDRPDGPKAVILSDSLWRNTFNADRNLMGQTIHLKGDSYTVVGILPAGAMTPLNADLYTDLQPSRKGEGGGSNYTVITRLRDGAAWRQADAEINRAWKDWADGMARQYGPGARVRFYSVPLQQGETATLRPQALTLMYAAGFILLIGCANLAGLTLVRVARRTPEIATRLALGASHWQIQKQLWIENLLLALVGGGAGVAVGYGALRGLLALLPEGYLPVAGVQLDLRVLAFTFTVSVVTSVLFGMLPAVVVHRVDLRPSMASRAVAGGERVRLRQVLIAGEVALTVVLLCSSGLLIRSLIHLETLPPGFDARGVMAAKASLDDARYHDPAAFRKLLSESTAAMQRIPGVESAAVGLSLPYEPVLNDYIHIDNGPEAGQGVGTDALYVTPGYFETLQMPLLAGRSFADSDGSTTQQVVIVNQTFARKFFPGVNPIGHTVEKGAVIVGVVADVPISSGLYPKAPLQTEETMYLPASQMNAQSLAVVHAWYQPDWIVRTAGPITGLNGPMQHALASVDPGLPFSGFYSLSDLLAKTLATQRIEVALLGPMAGLALLLSSVGLFALMANLVAQRTREIGIRIALGSTVGQAMAKIAGPGIGAAGLGLALGLACSAVALRVMRSVVYGVNVYDWPSIVAVVGTLAAVAALATALPTMRIASIDPARTLREE
jgi:macrolide transport system ATP-binding/permease protein